MAAGPCLLFSYSGRQKGVTVGDEKVSQLQCGKKCCLLNSPGYGRRRALRIDGALGHARAEALDALHLHLRWCAFVRVCVCVCARACMCAHKCTCVCAHHHSEWVVCTRVLLAPPHTRTWNSSRSSAWSASSSTPVTASATRSSACARTRAHPHETQDKECTSAPTHPQRHTHLHG
jgi:hypothetical protein